MGRSPTIKLKVRNFLAVLIFGFPHLVKNGN